jgi:6-phosphogluconate dehydrogenase
MSNEEKIINAESLNIDSTLDEIAKELSKNDVLILDVGNNQFNQTDAIYDSLVMRGYDVHKSFKNGRNQVIVANKK